MGFLQLERSWRPSEAELLRDARLALVAGRFPEAVELAEGVLDINPHSPSALLVAGEASSRLNQFPQALDYYGRAIRSEGEESRVAQWARAEILHQIGRLREAELSFQQVLEDQPKLALAHQRLVQILGMLGRRWESVPHLVALLQSRQFDLETLLFLGNLEQLIELPARLEQALATVPEDPLPQLGLARLALRDDELSLAQEKLQPVVEQYPELAEAQVRWGQLLLRLGDEEAFQTWETRSQDMVSEHPDAWVVRGEWALQRGEREVAARCFWEALRRHPNHRTALYQLGQLLQSWQRETEAVALLERHERLTELTRLLDTIYGRRDNTEAMRQAAERLESLGRLWEAWGWYEVIVNTEPQLSWAREQRDRLRANLDTQQPSLQLEPLHPARLVDLSALPLPDYLTDSLSESRIEDKPNGLDQTAPRGSSGDTSIRFVDRASDSQLDFTYFGASDPDSDGRRMYEFAGGGVGVLDLDGDGWPDLYLVQSGEWPPNPHQDKYENQLFRNLGNGRFQNVTQKAGVGDRGFGQGVTIGDVNDDGFPDIYVANIGRNRLLLNNGDGTFWDATEDWGIESKAWTTSCVLADLNGDGLPDLYDVNYLSGEDIFTRLCEWPEGRLRICGPATFQPQQDEVYLNSGTGRFLNQTTTSGIVLPGGNGLGVVAADFDDSGKLSLFIANDQTANFLLANETAAGSSQLSFQDQALSLGLAYDRDGNTQACMGVAAGDATGNGLLDLFVTNFYQESNTFYMQRPGPFFTDETRRARLREPSFSMLGFGTQFLDADLDGHLDLVLTNGHLDDFTYLQQPYEMPPQFFRNQGAGTFEEISPGELGDYFQNRHLGRALARVDWNRDGRDDFVVTHLDAPVALLTNATKTDRGFLAVQLRGVASARDAIGATVRVRAGRTTWIQQLTAGDGYLVSNQRQLIFGLADHSAVDELQVQWPSGHQQTFRNPPVNAELILIEGHDSPVLLAPAVQQPANADAVSDSISGSEF